MKRPKKETMVQVDALARDYCMNKGTEWAQEYPLNLFSNHNDGDKFSREDLRESFIAGIKSFMQSVWHDARKELPKDGEWCLIQGVSGFRLATRRAMQSGVYMWWFMDYAMYDGKGIERWAYISDLMLYRRD